MSSECYMQSVGRSVAIGQYTPAVCYAVHLNPCIASVCYNSVSAAVMIPAGLNNAV